MSRRDSVDARVDQRTVEALERQADGIAELVAGVNAAIEAAATAMARDLAPTLARIGAVLETLANQVRRSVLCTCPEPWCAVHSEDPPPPYRKHLRTWYRSMHPDGSLWCEASDPDEVREAARKVGGTLERYDIYEVSDGWRTWVFDTPAEEG